MSSQLILPFGTRTSLSRDDFVVAPCNETAFRFIDRWPDWPTRTVALFGSPGCGKSHLANVWSKAANATTWSAASLLGASRAREQLAGLPEDSAIVIDRMDFNEEPHREYDSALLAILDRRAGAIVFIGRSEPKTWPAATGDLKSRFSALLNFPMWAPDDMLLSGIARKLFQDRQIEVREGIIRQLVGRLERTPAAIAAFVTALDRRALAEKRPVSERLVAELLEGEASR